MSQGLFASGSAPQEVPLAAGVKTHVPTRLPGVPETSQLSVVHELSSLQILVAQGFSWVVTTRSVQSHFDPVPACWIVWQETLWLAFCSQTRQEGMRSSPLTILQSTVAMTVQSTGPAVARRSPHVSVVLGVDA